MFGLKLQKSGTFLLLVALFLFALYSNVALIIRNYHLNQKVSALRAQVDSLTVRDQKLALLNDYYASASYQNVQARGQLQLKNPAETTLIVQGVTAPTQSLSDQLSQQITEQVAVPAQPLTNFQRWWRFFFD